MKPFLKYDWDAIAGIFAAMAAIVMHSRQQIPRESLFSLPVVEDIDIT